MKIWKLISGILSICLSLINLLQSCTISCLSSMAQEQDYAVSGFVGFIVAIMIMGGGIHSIATMNKKGLLQKDANLEIIEIFGIAMVLAFFASNNYPDLKFYGGWCLICALVAGGNILYKNFILSEPDQENEDTTNETTQELWITCLDNSMEPTILSGARVLINKASLITSGEIALVTVNGNQNLIRKVVYGHNYIELQPINKSYPIMKYENDNINSVKIIGTVQKIENT